MPEELGLFIYTVVMSDCSAKGTDDQTCASANAEEAFERARVRCPRVPPSERRHRSPYAVFRF